VTVLLISRPWKHPTTGVYYYRRVVPADLRPFASGGKTEPRHEYKRSLHTKSEAEAKRLHPHVATVGDNYFATLQERKAKAQTATLSQPAGGVPTSSTPGLGEPPAPFSRTALRSLAGELADEIIARNADDPPTAAAFRLNRAIPPGPWGGPTEPWSGHRYVLDTGRRTRMAAALQEHVTVPCREFLKDHLITLSAEDWETFCEEGREAIDSALDALQRRYRLGDLSDAPVRLRFPLGAPARRPKVSIKGLMETWAKVRANTKPATYEKYDRRLREFAAFLSHDDALAVTSKDLRRWRDHLKVSGLAVHTINADCVGPVITLFKLSAAEEVIPTYPFPGSYALKEDTTRPKARRGYEDHEAAQVLNACRKEKDAALRWIPWLLAYTGARVGEMAQLRAVDVREKDGIRYLQITNEGEGQSVKTSASRRDVPVHRAVIREGFMKFVASIPKGGYLFGALSGRTNERKAAGASQNYMRWLRSVVGITDKRLVSHSWRHRMEDQLREIDAPEEVAAAITGRTRFGSRAGYGKGPSLVAKSRWLEKVPAVTLGSPKKVKGSKSNAP